MIKQFWITTLCLALSTFVSGKQALQIASSNIVQQHYSSYLEALEQSLTNLGINYNHQILPGNRLNSHMDNDLSDLITLMARSNINQGNTIVIEPEVTQGYIYFYYHKDTDLQNLTGKTISIIAGIEYQREFTGAHLLNEVQVNDVDVAIRMVDAGRTIGTLLSSAAQARLDDYPNVRFLEHPVAIETFHIAVSKRHTELVAPLTEIVTQLKADEAFNYRRLDGSLLYQNLPN